MMVLFLSFTGMVQAVAEGTVSITELETSLLLTNCHKEVVMNPFKYFSEESWRRTHKKDTISKYSAWKLLLGWLDQAVREDRAIYGKGASHGKFVLHPHSVDMLNTLLTLNGLNAIASPPGEDQEAWEQRVLLSDIYPDILKANPSLVLISGDGQPIRSEMAKVE